MFKHAIAVVLSVLLILPTQGSQPAPLTVQEKAVGIALGSIVEVKTKLKTVKTVRGRLAAVTKEGIELQVAKGQSIESMKIAFDDVKNISEKNQQKGPGKSVYILAGAGVVLIVLLVIGIASAGFSQ